MLWKDCTRWLALVSLVALLGGCAASPRGSGDTPIPTDTGTVMLTASGWTGETSMYAELVFERGRHSFVHTAAISDHTMDITLDVPVGTWDITMVIVDDTEHPLYQDSAEDITVLPDEDLQLSFQLRPANGLVSLTVDLEQYPNAEKILRARVHFDDSHEEITIEPGETLADDYDLPPGSYDFKVELFTDSFRSTDQIDPGVWTQLDVYSQELAEITWRPAKQEIHIDADIYLVPEAPELQASKQDQQVSLVWEYPADTTAVTFTLLWRSNPFAPFSELVSLSIAEREHQHCIADLADEAAFVEYTICAVSTVVQGYRASPVRVEVY